jgi:hypothetical protein
MVNKNIYEICKGAAENLQPLFGFIERGGRGKVHITMH